MEKLPAYDPSDKIAAMRLLMEHDEMVTGLIYERQDSTSFEDLAPGYREQGIVNQDWTVPESEFKKLLAGYR